MKDRSLLRRPLYRAVVAALFSLFSLAATAQNGIGPGQVIVQPKFGGGIFGYDIDQSGSEGVLTELQQLSNGNVLSAIETFDQKTGKIIKVLSKTETQDNDITLGVVGTSTGLIEHDHVDSSGSLVQRTYNLINPLNSNKFTGQWTPPQFDKNYIIEGVSRIQGTATTSFLVLDNIFPGFSNNVIGSNVAKNTFGPLVKMTDPTFEPYLVPEIGFDAKTNLAVLAAALDDNPTAIPEVGLINVTTGTFTHFQTDVGGSGGINGLAVDSEDGIACTTTQSDASIEFYDLRKKTGFSIVLPGGQTGADVQFDPINKLFLVAQPISGTSQGSSIQVYDTNGNLVDSLNGFNFSNRFTVIPTYIALNPKLRSGFVQSQVNQDVPNMLQSFTY
jgi:hypothetical protein